LQEIHAESELKLLLSLGDWRNSSL